MLSFARAALVASIFAVAAASGDHDDHGSEPFEWAGIFATPNPVYFWQAEKVDGAYADPAMRIALFSAPAATEAALHDLEEAGGAALELSNCTEVRAGETLLPAAATCYSLIFDESSHSSVFKINAAAADNLAIGIVFLT